MGQQNARLFKRFPCGRHEDRSRLGGRQIRLVQASVEGIQCLIQGLRVAQLRIAGIDLAAWEHMGAAQNIRIVMAFDQQPLALASCRAA